MENSKWLLFAGILLCVCSYPLYRFIKKIIGTDPGDTISLPTETVETTVYFEDIVSSLKLKNLNREQHVVYLGLPSNKILSKFITVNSNNDYKALIIAIFNPIDNTINIPLSKIIYAKDFDKKTLEIMGNEDIVKLA